MWWQSEGDMPENRRGRRGVDEPGRGVRVERPLAPPGSGHELDRVLGEDGTGRSQRLAQVREVGGQAGGPLLEHRRENGLRARAARAGSPSTSPATTPPSSAATKSATPWTIVTRDLTERPLALSASPALRRRTSCTRSTP